MDKNEFCLWTLDDDAWDTSCENRFIILEGIPKENNMKYCCYCGKLIVVDANSCWISRINKDKGEPPK